MKRILVIFVSLIIVGILGSLFFQKQAKTQMPKEFLFNIKDKYKVERVILKREPSEIPKTAKLLKVEYEVYKKEEIAKWFGAGGYKYTERWKEKRSPEAIEKWVKIVNKMASDPNYTNKEKELRYLKDEGEEFYFEGGPMGYFLTLNGNGSYRLVVHTPDPYINGYSPTKITFSEEEADNRARKWIEEHGGFPDDAKLVRTRNVVEVPLSFEGNNDDLRKKEKSEVMSYYLHYRHRFDGKPIFDDEIKVKIVNPSKLNNNDGIESYYRIWTNPIGYIGEEEEIITPKEAIEKMATRLAKESGMKSDTPPIINVKFMNLVYYDSQDSKGEKQEFNIFRPAWHLKWEDGPNVLIDAYFGDSYFR